MSVKKDKCFNQMKKAIKGIAVEELSWLFFELPNGKPLMIPMGTAPQNRYKNDLVFLQEACATFSGAKNFKAKYSNSPTVFTFNNQWVAEENKMLLTEPVELVFK